MDVGLRTVDDLYRAIDETVTNLNDMELNVLATALGKDAYNISGLGGAASSGTQIPGVK